MVMRFHNVRRALWTGLLAGVLHVLPATGQDLAVPVRIHFPILQKAILFDRSLDAGHGKTLRVGILYQSRFYQSREVRDSIAALFEERAPGHGGTFLLELCYLDVADESELDMALQSANPKLLYVCPLRGFSIKTVSMKARNRSIHTITGVPEYISRGLAVGVGLLGERPQILVNDEATKGEGSEFSSQFLKLVRIVH